MKKIFLSAVIALALCSYGYAQDEEEYEEEEAPAKVVKKAPAYEEDEEEEEAAPAPKKEKKKVKKSSGDQGFFGIGLDLTGALSNDPAVNLSFRLNDDMVLSAIFGFVHAGKTTVKAAGQETDLEDDNTVLAIGAAFDYTVVKKFIPFSIGGEVVYNSPNEDDSELDFGVMAGLHGEIIPNLVLSGKTGLAFMYNFGSNYEGQDGVDYGKITFGIAYKVYLTWYAF